MPVTRRWSGRAHLTWASSQFLFLAYLVFILQWTVASGLGFWTVAGGLLLWVFEVVAGVLASAYLWELCDTLGSEYWRRRVTRSMSDRLAASSYEHDGTLPFVSMHVPAHNEPPEMVIETLQSLQHRSLRPRPAPRPRRRHRHPRPPGRPGLLAVDPALADPGADRPTLHAERSRSQPVAVLRSCNRTGART
jgi:hypothetical protein